MLRNKLWLVLAAAAIAMMSIGTAQASPVTATEKPTVIGCGEKNTRQVDDETIIRVSGNGCIQAHGTSIIEAHGNVIVGAHDNSVVTAYDNVTLVIYNRGVRYKTFGKNVKVIIAVRF